MSMCGERGTLEVGNVVNLDHTGPEATVSSLDSKAKEESTE